MDLSVQTVERVALNHCVVGGAELQHIALPDANGRNGSCTGAAAETPANPANSKKHSPPAVRVIGLLLALPHKLR